MYPHYKVDKGQCSIYNLTNKWLKGNNWLKGKSMKRIGYLGPQGTFTHEAAVTYADGGCWEFVDYSDIPGLIQVWTAVKLTGRGTNGDSWKERKRNR